MACLCSTCSEELRSWAQAELDNFFSRCFIFSSSNSLSFAVPPPSHRCLLQGSDLLFLLCWHRASLWALFWQATTFDFTSFSSYFSCQQLCFILLFAFIIWSFHFSNKDPHSLFFPFSSAANLLLLSYTAPIVLFEALSSISWSYFWHLRALW